MFIHDDFLLDTPQARELFHGTAEALPIIDYHSHLDPAALATDKRFANITQAWLAGDHYKWRAMRTAGIPEAFCSGTAPDREKFNRWAAITPKLIRNPLYHWTHLELRRPFGITDVLLSAETADSVWERTSAAFAKPDFGARGILNQMKVELVCTTDDPVDSLEHHVALAKNPSAGVKVLPTWRADKARNVVDVAGWSAWVDKLAAQANREIVTFDDFMAALQQRHDFFHACGCRVSDYAIDGFSVMPASEPEAKAAFARLRSGKTTLSVEEALRFSTYLLDVFGAMDCAKGWVRQLHLGAMRNPNGRAFMDLGPDTGFDAISDFSYGVPLAALLNRAATNNTLPKTILYNLNPRDNELLAVMCGSFQDGSVAGKVQFGAAWWFLDQMDGMTRHIETISQLALLSQFVGMLTDSRSFLSFPRHEYFRRILCRILGRDMQGGLIPNDMKHISGIVADISYNNAKGYFGF